MLAPLEVISRVQITPSDRKQDLSFSNRCLFTKVSVVDSLFQILFSDSSEELFICRVCESLPKPFPESVVIVG